MQQPRTCNYQVKVWTKRKRDDDDSVRNMNCRIQNEQQKHARVIYILCTGRFSDGILHAFSRWKRDKRPELMTCVRVLTVFDLYTIVLLENCYSKLLIFVHLCYSVSKHFILNILIFKYKHIAIQCCFLLFFSFSFLLFCFCFTNISTFLCLVCFASKTFSHFSNPVNCESCVFYKIHQSLAHFIFLKQLNPFVMVAF